MGEYTNDFKDDAGLSDEVGRKAQQMLLQAAVQRAIFCPITGRVLDMRTAVLVVPKQQTGRMVVIDGSVWDDQHEDVAAGAAAGGYEIEVYDGRELWPDATGDVCPEEST